MPELVSVIIPTYNRAHILRCALDSVFSQTYPNLQAIVVDDGSTDGTDKLLSGLNYPIQLLRKANGGVSSARNAGLDAAQGEFIAFLDSDDYWLPTKIEKQMKIFNENPAVGFVYCGIKFLALRNGEDETRFPKEGDRGDVLEKLVFRNFMPTPTVILRREVVDFAGKFPEELSFGEDWFYWTRAASAFQVDYVKEILVVSHTLPGSLSKKPKEFLFQNQQKRLKMVLEDSHIGPKISGFKQNLWAELYQQVGADLMVQGENKKARNILRDGISYGFWMPRNLILYIKTFLPNK